MTNKFIIRWKTGVVITKLQGTSENQQALEQPAGKKKLLIKKTSLTLNYLFQYLWAILCYRVYYKELTEIIMSSELSTYHNACHRIVNTINAY